ncbi:MAG: peptidylprolyl isomerase [Colwellia sp.]|nr:peptidylprolyl isomerase [Colwellia sp.]MCW8863639.1 peptidylprolyl isomerase [Colwellia sp.]MCW9080393.1 peptidylprolyl isomerase [Colwellia sp.]
MLLKNRQDFSDKYLWFGLALGAIGFLFTLVWDVLAFNNASEPEPSLIATVNNISIDKSNYLNQLNALAEDKRNELSNQDAERVLSRIIEEELLVQRGLEVRLAETDRQTRTAIVSSMISMITADAKSYQPNEQELKAFYQQYQNHFKHNARFAIQKLNITSTNAMEDAKVIAEQLGAGIAIEQLLNEQVQYDRYVPNSLLPLNKLVQYLGPTLAHEITTKPLDHVQIHNSPQQGVSVYVLSAKERGQLRPFAEVKKLVSVAFVKERADQALRDYLVWLNKRADVEIFTKAKVITP